MSLEMVSSHINFDQLVQIKIPALSGRKAENNRLIVEHIATRGPLLKYDIFKGLKTKGLDRYSTVSRRVDSLVKNGYLAKSGERVTERGRQEKESTYGLTWKGFIASLTIKKVRETIFKVLEKNPLLTLPEKETVLVILEELVTQQEIETISRSILEAFLKTIPNLELVENEPMNLLAWLLSIKEKPELPKDFKLRKMPKDPWELLGLLDKPDVLEAVKNNIIPLVRQKTKEIEAIYQLLSALNTFCDFISNLDVEDQPSKSVKEYIETELASDPNIQKLLREE